MARVVFMGTPAFAVMVLEALLGAHEVVGVVTQPDRPVGRGRRLSPSEVKKVAVRRFLSVYQPQSLSVPQAFTQMKIWHPDVIVAAACGHLLPQELLDLPRHGAINVHASLLPRWRGAAPIARAILSGDDITGVTIMKMDAGLDTGPILAQREEPIHADDTRASLLQRLSRLGAELLLETLPSYLLGELVPQPQPAEGVTEAQRLQKRDGLLDWSRPAVELERQVRAFAPWPSTFTYWQGQRLKVLRAIPLPSWRGDASPGTVVADADGAAVATGEGVLHLDTVQLAGKRPMDAGAFIRGHSGFIGGRLTGPNGEGE